MIAATLNTILALAIPWYAGALVVTALFPTIPSLGRIGIGWGIGLGCVTWLMFILSVLHIPFTPVSVTIALLVCLLAFAWLTPRLGLAPSDAREETADPDAPPAWLRWPMIAMIGTVLALCTLVNTFWPVADWDALAAYDLRGRAFARFDSATIAAHHGNLTYSFWLPPFTSLGHAWLYEFAGPHAPVKLLYTTCFAALIAAFIAFVTIYRSALLAYLTVPGLLLSPLLDQAFIAYTNLPSAYGVFIATWATYTVMRTGNRRWCLLAGVFWGFAMWTRQSLDPFVGFSIAALCIPWLRQRRIPWYPLIAAGIALSLSYSWLVYAVYLLYHDTRVSRLFSMLQSWVVILGPAVALSGVAFLRVWAYRRALHRHLLASGIVLGIATILGLSRTRYSVVNLSLLHDVFGYLRDNLWPLWGPLLLVFAICYAVGLRREGDNTGYVVLFAGYCAIFVVSTYFFAIIFSGWRDIPGSAVRHSYAVLPVFWACIGIMPGTKRMIAALIALRPVSRRALALQGD